ARTAAAARIPAAVGPNAMHRRSVTLFRRPNTRSHVRLEHDVERPRGRARAREVDGRQRAIPGDGDAKVDVGLEAASVATGEVAFEPIPAPGVGDDGPSVGVIVLSVRPPEPELDAGSLEDGTVDAGANDAGQHEAGPDVRPHGSIRFVKGIPALPRSQRASRPRRRRCRPRGDPGEHAEERGQQDTPGERAPEKLLWSDSGLHLYPRPSQ